jgi:glycerol-1-phosphate dehydrogenase [NAD(P)+]
MGFDAAEDGLLTSADVLIKFLKLHRRGKSVFLLGTKYLEDMFRAAEIKLFDHTLYEKSDMSAMPDIAVTSFDTSLVYQRLERACTYIRNGAEWLTTHPDINCPVEYGYIPDSGAINELVRASTGKPLPRAFGKPGGEVVDMLEEIYGVKREDMAIFGDRLYTDIALGKKNGMTAVLVLTGEASLEDAMNLPEQLKPDLIFKNLKQAEEHLF